MDIEFENGHYGERAVLRSAWSDRVSDELRSRRCRELEINHAKGWRGTDVAFLALLPWLRALTIVDLKLTSVDPVHELRELRALQITTYCRTAIRFSRFPGLEDCGLEWRAGAESLFECPTLKRLFINNYTGTSLASFSQLSNLESLAILTAPIETLGGIETLRKLRVLRLANLKNLTSLAGLRFLSMLEELEVHTCRKVGSIEDVAALARLRKLHLNNDGKLESLEPLSFISSLESVLFYESTDIVDGDLSPLVRQKNLTHVSFRNRRHYSHRREEFGAASGA